jgi:hypothetical protein
VAVAETYVGGIRPAGRPCGVGPQSAFEGCRAGTVVGIEEAVGIAEAVGTEVVVLVSGHRFAAVPGRSLAAVFDHSFDAVSELGFVVVPGRSLAAVFGHSFDAVSELGFAVVRGHDFDIVSGHCFVAVVRHGFAAERVQRWR